MGRPVGQLTAMAVQGLPAERGSTKCGECGGEQDRAAVIAALRPAPAPGPFAGLVPQVTGPLPAPPGGCGRAAPSASGHRLTPTRPGAELRAQRVDA
jgi:hypothetical protein